VTVLVIAQCANYVYFVDTNTWAMQVIGFARSNINGIGFSDDNQYCYIAHGDGITGLCLHVREKLAREWPSSQSYLKRDCQVTVVEFLAATQLYHSAFLPEELASLIVQNLIQVWPTTY